MRYTLKQTNTMKDAYNEIMRLDELFYKTFNRNAKADLLVYYAGDPKLNPTCGITLSYDEKDEKDAEFYKEQVTK